MQIGKRGETAILGNAVQITPHVLAMRLGSFLSLKRLNVGVEVLVDQRRLMAYDRILPTSANA
ncbi:MAG: hypothetical protein AB7U73_14795 [Pirellulales bacterium]